MPRIRPLVCAVAFVSLGALSVLACDDTGDSTSVTSSTALDASCPPTSTSSTDAATGATSGRSTGSTTPTVDSAAPEDSATGDAGAEDATAADASASDAGAAEDGGSKDATVSDSGAVAASADAGEAGTRGPADGGIPIVDAAAPTTLYDGASFTSVCAVYTGPVQDVGDAGDAGTAGTAGCSETEVIILERDRTGNCYNGAAANGILDDNTGDVGNECEDVKGNATAGAKVGTPRSELCLETLRCILNVPLDQDTCATQGQPTFCYCGAGVGPAACSALTTTPMGACTQVEADGLELDPSNPIPVLKAYENTALGAAQANVILLGMASNSGADPRLSSCFSKRGSGSVDGGSAEAGSE